MARLRQAQNGGLGEMLKSIQLTNLLSFGEKSEQLELGPLNVLIGPNGSGKSNLVDALEILKAAPRDLHQPIREAGGVHDWLWKGAAATPVAGIEAVVSGGEAMPLRYALSFTADEQQRFQIVDERIEDAQPHPRKRGCQRHYHYRNGKPVLCARVESGAEAKTAKGSRPQDKRVERRLRSKDLDPTESILSQRKDPDQYPELAHLGRLLGKMDIYRDWAFGRQISTRAYQRADLPDDRLLPDASNLGPVLRRLRQEPEVKQQLLEQLHVLYEGIEDFGVRVEGGAAQVFIKERGRIIPASHLSDGTLRYLCLLAVLCHPEPVPLICIEEPELGVHPDSLNRLVKVLRAASLHTQVIITTHSDFMLDAFTSAPEAVVVVEQPPEGTSLKRLSAERWKKSLETERLGLLWMSGEIGGVRW